MRFLAVVYQHLLSKPLYEFLCILSGGLANQRILGSRLDDVQGCVLAIRTPDKLWGEVKLFGHIGDNLRHPLNVRLELGFYLKNLEQEGKAKTVTVRSYSLIAPSRRAGAWNCSPTPPTPLTFH